MTPSANPRTSAATGTLPQKNMAGVDVAMCLLGKPYQSSLSVLSLLRYSGQHINSIYLHFEPTGSRFDALPPYFLARYLGEKAKVFQPEEWLKRQAYTPARLADTAYRHAIRYQTAFEDSKSSHLFVMHNDVLIKKDIIGAMLDAIGDAFVVGSLGQCWNCPASKEELTQAAGIGPACKPDAYHLFQPAPNQLSALYAEAVRRGFPARPYWEGWAAHYSTVAWPLPECRVNEWGCLVNLALARPLTAPFGPVPPFGVFEECGSINLDTAVAWFRECNRNGLRAKNFAIASYLTHWVGNNKMTPRKYALAEDNAKSIISTHFPQFVEWCNSNQPGLF